VRRYDLTKLSCFVRFTNDKLRYYIAMTYAWQRMRRHTPRLPDPDVYRAGAFFVTAVTRHRRRWFADPTCASIALDGFAWLSGAKDAVDVDTCIVMPDHMHAIFILKPGHATLAYAVNHYKGYVTRQMRLTGLVDFAWQQRYYERVIHNEPAMQAIRRYIANNKAPRPVDP
jgi:REP element-mobilizing transposase RayT